MTTTQSQWLTVNDVATQIGVSKMTVYRVIQDGSLLGHRIGRSIRIRPRDLVEYLRSTETRQS